MVKRRFEKLVPIASLEELLRSRKIDYRAKNEVKTLNRHQISASYTRKGPDFFLIHAESTTSEQYVYLCRRGYDFVKEPAKKAPKYSDVVLTILNRPRTGAGGGIPLTRGEVAMLFLDGYAGDAPGLLDIRSQGYGDDDLWDGLTDEDVIEDENTMFVWGKWEPLELWPE